MIGTTISNDGSNNHGVTDIVWSALNPPQNTSYSPFIGVKKVWIESSGYRQKTINI